MKKTKILFLLLIFLAIHSTISSQNAIKDSIDNYLNILKSEKHYLSNCKIRHFHIDNEAQKISLVFSKSFAMIPFTEFLVDSIKNKILSFLPINEQAYDIDIFANKDNIEDLVPNLYRLNLPCDTSRLSKSNIAGFDMIKRLSVPVEPINGLNGRNIALWNSHGWHYEQRFDRWEWQRARLLNTVEDKFTTQLVLNFIVPMLENAGATIFLPRERDPQTEMIICDNDTAHSPPYSFEVVGNKSKCMPSEILGFANTKSYYIDKENPFLLGTALTMKSNDIADLWVRYKPTFKQSGWYSVSVCHSNSVAGVKDAYYKVCHSGGTTEFLVNQQVAGGTWIYLGTFFFDKNDIIANRQVVLSNRSKEKGKLVIADAVKFGGGMGNIGRKPATQSTIDSIPDKKVRDNAKLLSPFVKDFYTTSNRAKLWEGARYYLQWAGMPFDVYSHSYGINDYLDDYASRPKWVNHLNYGSANAPDSIGLKLPIDLSLAIHSDAGIDTSSTIGSLAIVSTENDEKTIFPNKQSRYASMDMANIILSEIKRDISASFDTKWNIRGSKNAGYAESRMPSVPSMILETMSHQNFNDMKLGLNPQFQFCLARAIYKGVLRFLAYQNGVVYEVQPLPVKAFSAVLNDNNVQLQWTATTDTLEPSSKPQGYIVYTRKQLPTSTTIERGFDNGIFVKDTSIILNVGNDTIFSYKITAVNGGGESFPSEILSVCRNSKAKGTILIVNGFTKTSAPEHTSDRQYKGFSPNENLAIAYLKDYSYTGEQHDFNIDHKWISDDSPGFGASYGDNEQLAVAGNSFDYPYIHGLAIYESGFSFCSSSVLAVEQQKTPLHKYHILDLILGKQKRLFSNLNKQYHFETFPSTLQNIIANYLKQGNALLVSGAYLGKDLFDYKNESDKKFARSYLHINWQTDNASKKINVLGVYSPLLNLSQCREYSVSSKVNEDIYAVESSDAIVPDGSQSYTVMRYSSNLMSCAVAHKSNFRTVTMAFPFEAIKNSYQRSALMRYLLGFLQK